MPLPSGSCRSVSRTSGRSRVSWMRAARSEIGCRDGEPFAFDELGQPLQGFGIVVNEQDMWHQELS